MSDDKYYPGHHIPTTPASELNQRQFHMERVLSRVSSATLVQVKKVTNKGEVKEVGTVDVLPLVNMQDGFAKQFKHQVVHGIPYFRLQGGADKAVILDPKVNDIGVMVLADRDISKVKKTKAQAPPGSWRRFDMADGLFFPCFLGGKPKCYVQFTDDLQVNISPDGGTTVFNIKAGTTTITSSKIVLDGTVYLGGADASRMVSAKDTIDSNGDIDVDNFLTKVLGK